MSKLIDILKQTEDSPSAIYNPESNTLTIEGVCMPENAIIMFTPLFEKIDSELIQIDQLQLNIHLRYVNSMSSKQLLRLLIQLLDSKKNVNIDWIHDSDDELMKMKGEELQTILSTESFNIKSKNIRL